MHFILKKDIAAIPNANHSLTNELVLNFKINCIFEIKNNKTDEIKITHTTHLLIFLGCKSSYKTAVIRWKIWSYKNCKYTTLSTRKTFKKY